MAIPASWRDLETPASLVDIDRMEANLQRTVAYCGNWDLSYRPHAKTHKSSELATLQLRQGAVGLTVATVGEAVAMSRVSDDLLLAYPFFGSRKTDRIFSLPRRVQLTFAVDSAEALQFLSRAAERHERPVGVLIEADVGLKRVGVPDAVALTRLAEEATHARGLLYRGVLLYPGHVRLPPPGRDEAIRTLSGRIATLLEALQEAGFPADVVSGGSTPTLFQSHQMDGLTEIRPGTGIFQDRTSALLESCAWEDCAYSVATTVVSTTLPGQAVVDAGSKALGKELVNGRFSDPSVSTGFGCVLDRPELRVAALSEEHAVIDLAESRWKPRLGEVVRVVPNHVCVSVNLTSRLWQVRGEEVLGFWEVDARR